MQRFVYKYTNAKYTTPLLYHPHYVIHGRLKAASGADLDLTCVRSVEAQFESVASGNCRWSLHRRGFIIWKKIHVQKLLLNLNDQVSTSLLYTPYI